MFAKDFIGRSYYFAFPSLYLPCRITSPLLLLAVAASLGACYILSLRNAEKKIIVGGHEVSLAHQYAAVGVFSLPVFYIAGAGAVLFWVLGIIPTFFCFLIY